MGHILIWRVISADMQKLSFGLSCQSTVIRRFRAGGGNLCPQAIQF